MSDVHSKECIDLTTQWWSIRLQLEETKKLQVTSINCNHVRDILIWLSITDLVRNAIGDQLIKIRKTKEDNYKWQKAYKIYWFCINILYLSLIISGTQWWSIDLQQEYNKTHAAMGIAINAKIYWFLINRWFDNVASGGMTEGL